MSRITRIVIFILTFLAIAAPGLAQSETPEFRLNTRRDFGYGNGSQVSGKFSLTIFGDESKIKSVTFLIDGQEMGVYTQPPFKHSFQTGQYDFGWHELTAVVNTTDGRTVTTPTVRLNFLSAEQQSQAMRGIFIPVIGGLLLFTLIGVGSQLILSRRNPASTALGAPRYYGIKGGTICPRCGRPFAIHFWSINLIGGVIDRCDYCGRWGYVRRRSSGELEAAEQAERKAAQVSEASIPGVDQSQMSEEERLKKMLDDSRYQE